jgi:hypothetical protein
MTSVDHRIRLLDQELTKFVGLAKDPQARDTINRLLDRRLMLMDERRRGFRFLDRRRLVT